MRVNIAVRVQAVEAKTDKRRPWLVTLAQIDVFHGYFSSTIRQRDSMYFVGREGGAKLRHRLLDFGEHLRHQLRDIVRGYSGKLVVLLDLDRLVVANKI